MKGNVATGNDTGFFLGGTSSARFEANVARLNRYGMALNVPGGDLGGGALQSTGQNTLSCNTLTSLFATPAGVIAKNNAWDHVPPTTGHSGNPDIWAVSTPPDTTGAALASPNCP